MTSKQRSHLDVLSQNLELLLSNLAIADGMDVCATQFSLFMHGINVVYIYQYLLLQDICGLIYESLQLLH